MYGKEERLLIKRLAAIILMFILSTAILFFIQGCSFLGTNHSEELTIDCTECTVKYGKNHRLIDNNLEIKGVQ